MKELKHLISYRQGCFGDCPPEFLGLGLSSRSNLCIHPEVERNPLKHVLSVMMVHQGKQPGMP